MKIHCIGIGGIGISAIARYYHAQGDVVTGSDRSESVITRELSKDGIEVSVGHNADFITSDTDRVIYTSAVSEDNQELQEARRLRISTMTYAEALGALTKQKYTLAVSGSHGKSTTTSLLALMLTEAGLDPTVIVGTRLKEFGNTNFRAGKSQYFVIEADEWNNSFHHYVPHIAVITNIDAEHLDTHGSLEGVIRNFSTYLKRVPVSGKIIINAQDRNSMIAIQGVSAEVITYDIRSKEWPLHIPGYYNQHNCEAAWRVAQAVGVNRQTAEKAVARFIGTWRRLEELQPHHGLFLMNTEKTIFLSDYAHHPTEIKAVIGGLREKHGNRKIVVFFQPHQAERLTLLFNDFISSFSQADIVGILPTYEVVGREYQGTKKTSLELVRVIRGDDISQESTKKNINTVYYVEDVKKMIEHIATYLPENPIVVFMGAGDIDARIREYFDSKLFT